MRTEESKRKEVDKYVSKEEIPLMKMKIRL
jgi:hypothetical protein